MQKDFDRWNKIKQKLDSNNSRVTKFPQEGEVWMSSLGLNIGFEQNGAEDNFARPVLILKRFNNKMFWTLALSTRQKNFDFNFTDPDNKKVSVIIAQIKLMSIKRIQRKLYGLDKNIFTHIKKITKSFL